MKKFLALALALCMILALCACGQTAAPATTEAAPAAEAAPAEEAPAAEADGKAEYKIGVSIMELTAYTWYQGVIDGCNNWLAKNGDNYGVNFTFDFEDSRSDTQTMLTNVENMLAAGSDGIILFPTDPSSAIPTMKENVAKGIPFVIGDYAQEASSPEDEVWATFVGHDNKALGVVAGEVAVEYLKTLDKEDPVCLFIWRPTSGAVAQARYDGFAETVLAAFPKATIIQEGDTGAGNRDSAQTLMENILVREPVIDVVCGHNDAEVVGAYNAAQQAGRTECKFIGIAGDIDVLNWIKGGDAAWLGEVLQDPCVLGEQATDAMYHALVLGEELPASYELPAPEAITPANIADYDYESWGWLVG